MHIYSTGVTDEQTEGDGNKSVSHLKAICEQQQLKEFSTFQLFSSTLQCNHGSLRGPTCYSLLSASQTQAERKQK